MGAAPLDPGQALAIDAQGRCGVEIGAFGEHLALAVAQVQRNQAVFDLLRAVGFFHGQYQVASMSQVTITPRALGQSPGCAAIERLGIHLLVGLVDEYQPGVAQAE
ncbi:hypothetical protein D9M73_178810 [compost metagenome]